jgi:hypothetical protein
MQKSEIKNILLVLGLLSIATISRLVDHPGNFTPMVGIMLFGVAYFQNNIFRFLVPISFILFSDIVLELKTGQGFHELLPVVYLAYALIGVSAYFLLKKVSLVNLGLASLISTTLFFLITNFAFFYPASAEVNTTLGYYPHNIQGIIASYAAGIPFFKNMLVGDLMFTGFIFGTYHLVRNFGFSFSKNY